MNGDPSGSVFGQNPYNSLAQAMSPNGLSAPSQVQKQVIPDTGVHGIPQEYGGAGQVQMFGRQPFSQAQYGAPGYSPMQVQPVVNSMLPPPYGPLAASPVAQMQGRRFGYLGAPVIGAPVIGPPVIGAPMIGAPMYGSPYMSPYDAYGMGYDPYGGFGYGGFGYDAYGYDGFY